jgi:hypothetical protein
MTNIYNLGITWFVSYREEQKEMLSAFHVGLACMEGDT